ncbi:MAG: type II toxin-antitoxin system RelE/ParE family toxin [Methylobacter sp.]
MSYYFHPGAEAEHFEAIAFFESRQPGLGVAYLAELEELMANVVHAPHRYRIERKPNIRRIFLKQFPFNVIFRDVEGVVQILAIAHKRRRPDYWLGRL